MYPTFATAFRGSNNMSFRSGLLVTAALLSVLAAFCPAKDGSASSPASSTYVMTNDDGLLHSYVSFYVAGTSQQGPTLTLCDGQYRRPRNRWRVLWNTASQLGARRFRTMSVCVERGNK